MGDIIEKNKTLKNFPRRIQKFHSLGKVGNTVPYCEVFETADIFVNIIVK